jgi:hypothetical protein
MPLITNAKSGIYEFKFSDVDDYETPGNITYTHDGSNNEIIDVDYDFSDKPISILPGLADLHLSIKVSESSGPYVEATDDFLNKIKITKYDYTNSESKMSAVIMGQNITLKTPTIPINNSNFDEFFTNIAPGYYYLFRIKEIPGYTLTLHSDIIWINVFKEQLYNLELKYMKTTSSYIRFEIPIPFDIGRSISPFNLNIVSGYSEDSIKYLTTYDKTIQFSGQVTAYDSQRSLYSGIYKTSDIFGSDDFGWIKPQEKSIDLNNSNNNILTILSESRNCTSNFELSNETIDGIVYKAINVKNLSHKIT